MIFFMARELDKQMDCFCFICPEQYTDILLELEDGNLEVLQKLSTWAYLSHFYDVCLDLEARILKLDLNAWLPVFSDMEKDKHVSLWLKEFCEVCTSQNAIKTAQNTYFKALYHSYFFFDPEPSDNSPENP